MSKGTKLFPGYKEAAKAFLEGGEGTFITDERLVELMSCESKQTDDFRFGILNLKNELLKKGVCLTRVKDGKRGYRYASDEEKVQTHVPQQHRRMAAAITRSGEILGTVDVGKLSDETKKRYDRQLQFAGFMAAAAQAGRRNTLEGKGNNVELRISLPDGSDEG